MKQKFNNKAFFKSQDSASGTYISSAWQQHTDLIIHLSQFSQNVLLVIAPEHGGKTTFLNHVAKMSLPTLQRVVISAKQGESYDALMDKIARAFEFTGEGMEAFGEHLRQRVQTEALSRSSVALMIDDAHYLSDEKIGALLDLIASSSVDENLLHLVLIGEPSLELRLFSPQWNNYLQGRIYTVELESWSMEDIRAFLGRDPFARRLNDQDMAELFSRSMGLPGLVVNERAPQNPKAKQTEKNTEKPNLKKITNHPVSLGILMGGLIGGGYLVFSGISDSENGVAPVNLAQISEETWNDDPISPQRTEPMPQAMETVAMETPAMEAGVGMEPAAMEPAAMEPVAMAPAEVSKPLAKEPLVPEPLSLDPAQTIPPAPHEQEAVTPAPLAKSEPTLNLSKEEKDLLALDKHTYTLQLLGARYEKNIKDFISRHGIDRNAYTYRTKLSGKDWFVVVYGKYSSKEEAKAAIASIPNSLKHENLTPWIREVDSIHQDIRQNRQA